MTPKLWPILPPFERFHCFQSIKLLTLFERFQCFQRIKLFILSRCLYFALPMSNVHVMIRTTISPYHHPHCTCLRRLLCCMLHFLSACQYFLCWFSSNSHSLGWSIVRTITKCKLLSLSCLYIYRTFPFV